MKTWVGFPRTHVKMGMVVVHTCAVEAGTDRPLRLIGQPVLPE